MLLTRAAWGLAVTCMRLRTCNRRQAHQHVLLYQKRRARARVVPELFRT